MANLGDNPSGTSDDQAMVDHGGQVQNAITDATPPTTTSAPTTPPRGDFTMQSNLHA
ncbi:hypothetical protein V1514DRAFT_322919, partial [Lipomyces japonicus]|uniref:uncharacterized protein n=1 Tax=Lipomyces japonicus TaxID=56871 RepID=UPI0034CFA654